MYGKIVRQARVARRMTQRELAVNAGIDQPNVSAIETGRRVPSAETLHRLLFACGFELLAVAGDRVIAFPPPDDDAFATAARPPGEELSADERSRRLTAVLDVADTTLRSR